MKKTQLRGREEGSEKIWIVRRGMTMSHDPPSYTAMCASTCTVCIQLYVELQAAKWKARDVARSLHTRNFVVFVFS